MTADRLHLLLLLGLSACAAAPPLPPDIGTARPHESVRVATIDAGPAPPVDAGPWGPSLLATLDPITENPVRSRGHLLEKATVRLLANERGRAIYGAATGEAEAGALLVAVHAWTGEGAESGRSSSDGVVMAMEKLARGASPSSGDWRYTLVDGDGNVTAEGAVAICVACHRDAPVDHVFRVGP